MKDLYISSLGGDMLRDFWKQRLRRVNFDAFIHLVKKHFEGVEEEAGFIVEQVHYWKPQVWKIQQVKKALLILRGAPRKLGEISSLTNKDLPVEKKIKFHTIRSIL